MATLIDSSILIAAERGRLNLDALLGQFPNEQIGLAAITVSELLHGVHRANSAIRRRRREAFVEQILAELPVFPFETVTARTHASLWAELAAKGVTVGAHDLLIAATAMSLGYAVATHDLRSFPRIPGLRVLRW